MATAIVPLSIPVTFEDGSTGIITKMLDIDGDACCDPMEATAAIAVVLTGPEAGRWCAWECDPSEFHPVRYH